MKREELHIGIIGAGGFSRFAAQVFAAVPGVTISAVMDLDESAAEQLATELQAKAYFDYNELLQDKSIDLIYIATPPFVHYEQSQKALLAGKHVICEKPAALKTTEAETLQNLAKSKDLLYVVNLMQRYNPLYQVVKKIIDQKILGHFLHGYFENYASDENLDAGHWFWDERKSGGIFIEHGVHFFDMFSGWFGYGNVLNATTLARLDNEAQLIDRVHASVLYGDAIVTFYHGFDQPDVLDRQELRLQFEKGDILLSEWVPVHMVLHGILEDKVIEDVVQLTGGTIIKRIPAGDNNDVKGRFTSIRYDAEVTIASGNRAEKERRYKEILTAMLIDQWSWIKNRNHNCVIGATNAVESVRMAEEASQVAKMIIRKKEVIVH
jgi:predicted dehydrogenase